MKLGLHTADLRHIGAIVRGVLISLAVATVAGGDVTAQSTRESMVRGVAEADVTAFAGWLEGRYDNELQVFFDRDLITPVNERSTRAHVVIRRVEGSALGAQVFYTENTSNPATGGRLLVLSADPNAQAVRMQVLALRPAVLTTGAWRTPAALSALRVEDTSRSCILLWRRGAGQFRSEDLREPCAAFGENTAGSGSYMLSPEELWIAATSQNKSLPPTKLRRARAFNCWVAVLRGAKQGDTGEGRDDWFFARNILIHDQGGEAIVHTDETPARDIRLRLRRVEWPYGTNRPSLTLYVHEGANARATSYAWGEYDAERLGLNLRWIQVSCTRAPERLFDTP